MATLPTPLEQRVVIYELVHSGHHIEHDSPAIGCWQEYGHWGESLGLYSSRAAALEARLRFAREQGLIDALERQVEPEDRDRDRLTIAQMSSDIELRIIEGVRRPEEIAVNALGERYFKGVLIRDDPQEFGKREKQDRYDASSDCDWPPYK